MNHILSAFSPVRNLKQLFIRPASNFEVLDGLRASSIVLIIILHSFTIYFAANPDLQAIDFVDASGWQLAWVWNSEKSVDIFFMISGFLITGILLRQIDKKGSVKLGNFYMRRFLRLGPAYWVVIALYAALGLPNIENLWANLLYVNNFLYYKDQAMNWTWTLAIEEQFYLIYPLLLLVLVFKTTRPLMWLWLLWFASFIVRFVVIMSDDWLRTAPGSEIVMNPDFHAHHFSVLYDNLYTRYGSLLSGCIAAYYYFHHEQALRRFLNTPLGRMLGLLSLAVVIALFWIPVLSRSMDGMPWFTVAYQTVVRNVFCAALAYLVLVCLEKSYLSKGLNLIFANRLWYPIAQLSYSMYLLHVFPIVILAQLATNAMKNFPERYDYSHFEAMSLIALYSLPITILGAMVIYLLVERPIMNLRS